MMSGRAWIGLGVAGLMMLAGCASRGGGGTPAEGAVDYAALYTSGQYQAALEASSKVAGSMRAYDKEKAALIAGLSAQALDRNEDAKKYLTPLVDDRDAGISGKAAAALGLIAQERKDHTSAASLLSTAAEKLISDDKARAAMYAGDSYRALGKMDDAKRMYMLAQVSIRNEQALNLLVGNRLLELNRQMAAAKAAPANQTAAATATKTPAGKATQNTAANSAGNTKTANAAPTSTPVQARNSFDFQSRGTPALVPNGFTVQAGAYSSWNSAISKASNLKSIGQTRIVEIRDPFGRRLYTVRMGNFSSMDEAEQFRAQVGRSAVVVPAER